MKESDSKNLDYEAIKDYYEYTSRLFDELENSLTDRANVLIMGNSIILGGCLISLSVVGKISLYTLVTCILTLVFSVLSIFYSISILRVYPSKNLDMRELMHFRVVEKLKPEEFQKKIIDLNKEKVIELYVLRIKAIAGFLVKRYGYLYYSFWFFVFTIIFFIIFISFSMYLSQGGG